MRYVSLWMAACACSMALAAGAQSEPAPQPLRLTSESRTVGRYARIEFTLAGLPRYANPFDLAEADVSLVITTPGGAKVTVPAFYNQRYERAQRGHGGAPADWFYPVGPPLWMARYAPPQVGRYTCAARVRDRTGVRASKPLTFTCVPSSNRGYLRVSRSNPRYLAFDNGAPFLAIGQNVAFVKDTYATEAIFGKMGAAGANYARVWTCCDDWGLCLEGRKSAWGRTWDWKPPFAPLPDGDGKRQCVKVSGADGASVPVSPSHTVALRPGTRYAVSGAVWTEGGARLQVQASGAPLGEVAEGPGRWTPFRREFTARAEGYWLEGMALRLAGAGTAYVRNLSLKEASGGPELLWEADPNRPMLRNYNLLDCAMLDSVVEGAERAGIYLQLCVLTRDLYMNRLRASGGRADDPALANARSLLRYAVARWGYSTHVAAWEYWNEMDPGKPTDAFYAEMGRYLAAADPYRHLLMTSDWADNPRNWQHPQLDVANMHYYLRPADGERFKDEVATVRERAASLLAHSPRRPALMAEFGLAEDNWQPSKYRDDAYLHLHNALWTSGLSGLAGTTLPWWWEEMDARGAYRHYRAFAAFVADIPFTTGRLVPVAPVTGDPRFRAVGLQGPGRGYFWLSDSRAAWFRQVVEKAAPQAAAGVTVTLTGLEPGLYRVEWWDTAAGKRVRSDNARAEGAELRLEAPAFTGDIACKVVRQGVTSAGNPAY